MSYWNERCEVAEMSNHVFTKVRSDGNEIIFENDEVRFVLYHEQDCCESVWIEDICGDLSDLEGTPILRCEQVDYDGAALGEYDESFTWTFYKFATIKGSVDVRFYGTSNGYYSESAHCRKESI